MVFDISNRRRFDVSCQDAITDVIRGLDKLMEIELSLPEPGPAEQDREVIVMSILLTDLMINFAFLNATVILLSPEE